MKVSPIFFALAALTLGAPAFAGILQTEDSATRVSGVIVSKGGKLSVEGRDAVSMITLGAGTRTKLGFLSIYVGELLVADQNKFACTEEKSLESLKDQAAVAVKLSILTGITEAQLEDAFVNGFESNKVKITPEIQKFMDSIKKGGPIPSGSKLVVAGERLAGGQEVVTYENAAGKSFSTVGGEGFVNAIFSLWIGKTDDGGLKNLRNNFVTCKIQ